MYVPLMEPVVHLQRFEDSYEIREYVLPFSKVEPMHNIYHIHIVVVRNTSNIKAS
jgi:hypothetical protein